MIHETHDIMIHESNMNLVNEISIAPEVLSVPSKEKVSLIKDLPVSFKGLGALGFLFPNIVAYITKL